MGIFPRVCALTCNPLRSWGNTPRSHYGRRTHYVVGSKPCKNPGIGYVFSLETKILNFFRGSVFNISNERVCHEYNVLIHFAQRMRTEGLT